MYCVIGKRWEIHIWEVVESEKESLVEKKKSKILWYVHVMLVVEYYYGQLKTFLH